MDSGPSNGECARAVVRALPAVTRYSLEARVAQIELMERHHREIESAAWTAIFNDIETHQRASK